MIPLEDIETKRLVLKALHPGDSFESYLKWINDPNITQYLEVRFSPPSNTDELRSYVRSINESHDQMLFGIFFKSNSLQQHIGNIKLASINLIHKTCEIGFMIGEKKFMRQGLAVESIVTVCEVGFDSLGLVKICAGCYADNRASAAALVKAGFQKEGIQRSQRAVEDKRQDDYLFGLTKREFASRRQI